MAYKIETGVMMPERRVRASNFPWDDLEIDQSFFIEGREKKVAIPSRLKPRKFSQAVMLKDGSGSPSGLRVKRTA